MADDDEQLEAIKNWWNENGTSLVVTLVVVVAGVFGYQAWENQQEASAEQASVIYEDLVSAIVKESPLQALSDDDISTGRFLAGRLQDEHSGSGYAQLATLLLAKLSVEAGDLSAAEKELRWVLDNGADESLEPIVRLRLARVLLAQEQTDAALVRLEGTPFVTLRKRNVTTHLRNTAGERAFFGQCSHDIPRGIRLFLG